MTPRQQWDSELAIKTTIACPHLVGARSWALVDGVVGARQGCMMCGFIWFWPKGGPGQ